MKLGVAINDTWAFFSEIFEIFQKKHETSLFSPRSVHFPFLNGRIQQALYRQDMRRFLSANRVCFFEWAGEYLAHATALPKKNGIVTRLHRYELYQWASQVDWEKVDRVILVSNAKQKEIESQYPHLASKTVVIPEGINLNKFKYEPKPYRKQLGILCHLSPRKRVYELITAFADGKLHKDGYTLHIGGGMHPKFPDYEQALYTLTRQLDLNGSVIFHGPVTDQQKWFDTIDIFISNSYSEGLQVSPMEAMARGRYCLSHTWDGADELLPHEHLFDLDSTLQEKIHAYSALSESEKLEYSLRQRKWVEERFDIQQVGQAILAVIDQVAENYR